MVKNLIYVWFVLATLCGQHPGLSILLVTLDDAVGDVFEAYTEKTTVLPVQAVGDKIDVDVGMHITSIVDVDSDSGTVTLTGYFTITWIEERLTPIADDVSVLFSGSLVWFPPLRIANSASANSLLASESEKVKLNLKTHKATWRPFFYTTVGCTGGKFFPFEEFGCALHIETPDHDVTELDLNATAYTIATDRYTENWEWLLASTSVTRHVKDTVARLDFALTIRRSSVYYASVIILPVVLISFLHSFVFVSSTRLDVRLNFSMKCFIGMLITTLFVLSEIPKSSSPVSIVIYFLFAELVLNAVATTLVILINRKSTRVFSSSVVSPSVPAPKPPAGNVKRARATDSTWGDNEPADDIVYLEDETIARGGKEANTKCADKTGGNNSTMLDKVLVLVIQALNVCLTVAFFIPLRFHAGN
ncbi:hypothetical protein DPMN_035393 [Dreissena polymorpha]|uniref:Neurotransmitter-gated ion-channel ligand-binding domain-containing protein n=1 Tax=Dreissena polymorpha TaxID=45954 RepID=A0A9D4M937_DREPO|nr:hypothetical protein DPMN_035393 [Dreissena polymorpha]